jgi:hypothetical protein
MGQLIEATSGHSGASWASRIRYTYAIPNLLQLGSHIGYQECHSGTEFTRCNQGTSAWLAQALGNRCVAVELGSQTGNSSQPAYLLALGWVYLKRTAAAFRNAASKKGCFLIGASVLQDGIQFHAFIARKTK